LHKHLNTRKSCQGRFLARIEGFSIGVIAFLTIQTCWNAQAGGSGLNTLVIVNQNSPNSCELGNYYCERRQVPPENVLRISWSGGNIDWTINDFQTNLVAPLLNALSNRLLTNQIDYVLLSMDIPYEIFLGSGWNSTTSALFYGIKDDGGPDYLSITNSYAASEQIFASARPASAPGFSFLATMITAPSLAQAKRLVDQGVTSDGLFPHQPVLLAKTSDPSRNVRYHYFDNAIFNSRFLQPYSVQRTNCDSFWGQTNLFGFQTGLANFSASPNTFIPGAMADSLSSFGGVIFGNNDQTSLMAFINAGASGSYGTVTEPSPIPAKFPDPLNYFYQARGFSLAECYYQSLVEPYEGLIVGEPLSAPCRRLALARWSGVTSNSILTGARQLSVRCSSSSSSLPLHQIDVFLDGKFFRTLTNLAPVAGSVLSVSLNGFPVNYTVPPDSTLATVASAFAATLNAPAVTNITKTSAFACGDRIELHSTSTNSLMDPFFVTDNSSPDSLRFYRLFFLPQPTLPSMTSTGLRQDGAFQMHIQTPTQMPFVIQASSDLQNWTPIFTNAAGNPMDFIDVNARSFSKRFYRIAGTILDPRPILSTSGHDASGAFKVHVDAATSAAYTLDASSDLLHWTALATNLGGGAFDFQDAAAPGFAHRFYRGALVPPPAAPAPRVGFVGQAAGGGSLLRVEGGVRPYVIQASSDLFNWTPVFTNLAPGQIQTTTGATAGPNAAPTTFITAAKSTFLTTTAFGNRQWSVNGTVQMGSWLQLTVTKPNGTRVSISATNQLLFGNASNLTYQLYAAINSHPALQGDDGLVAEDLGVGSYRSTIFTLRARTAGLEAANIRVMLAGPSAVVRNPNTEQKLTSNLSDLQPRNHLFVTAGLTSLTNTFTLDTTTLADGYHELTAVAYEGSHVHTQSRTVMPVMVKNSNVSAVLSSPDLGETNSVAGTYHIQVAANTNNVAAIRLYSTGGLLDSVTNQASATFTLNASYLGNGRHPLYAIVDTVSGAQYRTQPQWVRFQ
jgi:uncharacterized protein (TIGR03790 family)